MNLGKVSKLTAILSLTKKGAELAIKLGELLDNDGVVYIPKRLETPEHTKGKSQLIFFENWQKTFEEVFGEYSQIICIMATGIVVRSLAPLLKSKFTDPAVVVVDEKGSFAISLLSGHVGGANSLAQEIAGKLKGQAVITTATDVRQKPALDMIAKKLDAIAVQRDRIKLFNRLLVEDKTVYLTSPFPIKFSIKEGFTWQNWNSNLKEPIAIISPYKLYNLNLQNYLHILPKNLVVGIGCRKGISLEDAQRALDETLDRYGIDQRSIKSLATIDFKGEEEGLKLLSQKMQIPLYTVTKEEINALEGTFEPSDWVKKSIGVGGVCQPAAKLVAMKGITIVPKQKIGPVTISVAVERSWWLDLDLETETSWLLQPLKQLK